MIDFTPIFGFLGSLTAASLFFPQVWKSYKTKKTKDLSWSGITIGTLNGIFWVVYGLLISNPFIYITNSVLFVGAVSLAFLKRKYS